MVFTSGLRSLGCTLKGWYYWLMKNANGKKPKFMIPKLLIAINIVIVVAFFGINWWSNIPVNLPTVSSTTGEYFTLRVGQTVELKDTNITVKLNGFKDVPCKEDDSLGLSDQCLGVSTMRDLDLEIHYRGKVLDRATFFNTESGYNLIYSETSDLWGSQIYAKISL